ncbi:MAG TPA: hypothetical protein VF712_09000 [Thermoleophilaceae bacterium]|jgi:hypothetical protein
MDGANTFDTPTTYRAIRAEYVLLAAGSGYLLWRKRTEVRWPVAFALFMYNDTLGYLPGAIAFRRSPNKKISKAYYAAYNLMHSALTGVAVGAAWTKLVRPEWALLGIPFHIGVDRGVFGNFLKPFSVPFEPEPHPVWERVRDELFEEWQGEPAARTVAASVNGEPTAPLEPAEHGAS